MGQPVSKLWLLFICAFSVFSCQPPQKFDQATQSYLQQFSKTPLQVLQITPVGKVSQPQQEIVIRFNQPMVTLSELGKKHSENSFVTIEPKMPGEYLWVHPQTLIFYPEKPWQFQKEYAVTVLAGQQSLLGFGLLRDEVSKLKALPPQIVKVQSLENPLQIAITFNQVVKLKDVATHLSLQKKLGKILRFDSFCEGPVFACETVTLEFKSLPKDVLFLFWNWQNHQQSFALAKNKNWAQVVKEKREEAKPSSFFSKKTVPFEIRGSDDQNLPLVTLIHGDMELPTFLRVGDKGYVSLTFKSEVLKKAKLTLESKDLSVDGVFNLNFPGFEKNRVVFPLQPKDKLNEDIRHDFFETGVVEALPTSFRMTLENQGVTLFQKDIFIDVFPAQSFEKRQKLGVLHSVKKRKIYQAHFADFASGKINLSVTLKAKEALKSFLQASVTQKNSQKFLADAERLFPYVLFPDSKVVFGDEAASWQLHLKELEIFLKDLKASQQTHGGFSEALNVNLVLGEFLAYAEKAGFAVQSINEKLKSRLFYFLDLEKDPDKKIQILRVLTELRAETPEIYAKLYENWEDLAGVSQMELAHLILRMNPLHPVQKKVRRDIDKSLAQNRKPDLSYWRAAFFALLTSNPEDQLPFEVFAKIFEESESQASFQSRYEAMLAFRKYLDHLEDEENQVELAVFFDDHVVMNSELTFDKPYDALTLTLEKLPQDFPIFIQKKNGRFVFYNIEVQGELQPKAANPFEKEASLGQQCYDQAGQKMQNTFIVRQKYQCRIDIYIDKAKSALNFTWPLLPQTAYTLPPASGFFENLIATKTHFVASKQQGEPGWHAFFYEFQPQKPGVYTLPKACLSAQNPSEMSACFHQKPVIISKP